MTFISNSGNGIESTGNTSTANVAGSTTLNGAINNSVTTIDITSDAQFPDPSPNTASVKIVSGNGTEYITYGGVSGNQLTSVSRGQFNSTAVAHDDGSAISGIFIGASQKNTQPEVMTSLKSDTAGTLYYDFSNDNSNWDTFPVTGFTVTANVHEFHTAIKGIRYFRTRFENGSSSATTSFRVYTYFGIF